MKLVWFIQIAAEDDRQIKGIWRSRQSSLLFPDDLGKVETTLLAEGGCRLKVMQLLNLIFSKKLSSVEAWWKSRGGCRHPPPLLLASFLFELCICHTPHATTEQNLLLANFFVWHGCLSLQSCNSWRNSEVLEYNVKHSLVWHRCLSEG